MESEYKKKKNRLDALFANKNDFKTYRSSTRKASLPCVPYLGVCGRERKREREEECVCVCV